MKKLKNIVLSLILVLMASSLLAACGGTFTITFDGSGGTLVSGETLQKIKSGSDIKPPVFEKTGYLLSWNYSDFDKVTSDLTVTAVWTPISYTIRYDGNGADEGETPDSLHRYDELKALSQNGFIKSGYTFQGWAASQDGEVLYGDGEEIKNLTSLNASTVTLYAKWSVRRFTYTFFDDDGTTLLKTETVGYGSPITAPDNPQKQATAEFTYTFAGWDKEIPSSITSDITFTARYTQTKNKYTYTFYNEGVVLKTETVEYGSAILPPPAPSKEQDEQYSYTFAGWDKEIPQVITANIEFFAQYTRSLRYYTYTFYDDDGITVLKANTVAYGSEIIPPDDPIKAPTAQYTYLFFGWDKGIPGSITGDISFTAVYIYIINHYTYYFFDNGYLIKQETVPYGSEIVLPDEPTKESDEQYVYTFEGWAPEIPAFITEDIAFDSLYSKALREYTYTFYDEDGITVLKSATVAYGSTIIPPDAPQKPPSAKYTFTFAGWNREIPDAITRDEVFVAWYHQEIRKYTVTFESNGGSFLPPVVLEYNSFVLPYDVYKEGFSLSAWYLDPQFENAWNFGTDVVTGDITLYAEWYNMEINFSYLHSGYFEVSNSAQALGTVYIPNTLNGRAIVGIAANAFKDAAITSIRIPKSVTYIGDYAFSGCTSLTRIDLPQNVNTLGKYVFAGCSSLEDIALPSNLTIITEGLFKDCVKLESMTLPEITQIKDFAFYGCKKLKEIVLPEGLESIGRYSFSGCLKFESISVPGSVTKIDEGAFENCVSLKEVELKEGIRVIGRGAFSGCSSLPGIDIPGSVENIGAEAFKGTKIIYVIVNAEIPQVITEDSLPDVVTGIRIYVPESSVELYRSAPIWENYFSHIHSKDIIMGEFAIESGMLLQYLGNEAIVTIPSGVTAIGSKVFIGNTLLKEIIIPDTVTVIGSAAFYDCSGLESVTLPDSVRQIGHFAFKGCAGLTELTIPQSVEAIGERAFEGCQNLETLTINGGGEIFGEAVFINCTALKTIIIGEKLKEISAYTFYGCTSLESIIIPRNVTIIGEYALYGCSSLAEVTISGVERIEEGAFAGCTVLQVVTLLANNPPSCNRFAFTGLPFSAQIFVPSESMIAYKTADVWSSYSSQIYAIPDET